jgi:hypothetical protein
MEGLPFHPTSRWSACRADRLAAPAARPRMSWADWRMIAKTILIVKSFGARLHKISSRRSLFQDSFR